MTSQNQFVKIIWRSPPWGSLIIISKKLKPSQLLFILFVPLYHLPIRLLHIKHLYKVGDGNLLGELLASLVE